MISQKISTYPRHTKSTFIYALALALQKFAFYGWRSFLFMLLISSFESKSFTDLSLWIAASLSVSYLIGGLFGDLLLGNRKASIIGGILMFIGSLTFFLSPTIHPYFPIGIFVVGCGFFQSNAKASFAKIYLHETKLLDAGFMLLNLFINVGAFLGSLVTYYFASSFGLEIGFLIVGISVLFSTLLVFADKKTIENKEKTMPNLKSLFQSIYLKPIGIVLLLYGFYVFFWRLSYFEINAQYWDINLSSNLMRPMWLDIFSAIFYLVIGVFLAIIWTKKYFKPSFNLAASAILTFMSFAVAYFLNREESTFLTTVTIISLFIYVFAETLVSTLIDSSIAKLINRKYLALAYGALGLISTGIGYVFSHLEKVLHYFVANSIFVGMGGLFALSIFFIVRKIRMSYK